MIDFKKIDRNAVFEGAFAILLAWALIRLLTTIFGRGFFHAEDAEDLENLGERHRAKKAAKRKARHKAKMSKIRRKKAEGRAAGEVDDDLNEDEDEEEEYDDAA